MSFSKSFTGNATAVRSALLAFAGEQRQIDEKWGAAPGVVEGHQVQIVAASEPLLDVLDGTPESATVSAAVWGHANADQSGNYGCKIEISCTGVTEAVAPTAG